LYDSYIEGIYKFIFLKIFDKEIAEDLTSEVFMKALKKIHTFKQEGTNTFKSWIYTIAYNTIIDYTRKRKENISIEDSMEK
jgi:RNA polymerase sigma-70 factor (ECF subfamily)